MTDTNNEDVRPIGGEDDHVGLEAMNADRRVELVSDPHRLGLALDEGQGRAQAGLVGACLARAEQADAGSIEADDVLLGGAREP